ncbi:hypothetical protein BLNAU_6892 [Blattamonas nauphoetae]|uniref:Uncharacterized protein n=1 Tax=Blattamonas nauphoetae TaxID=2049346 RepID=A0ABQ9Y374_9EUKA|nr:hypothetical protein BLNAU_6892 [Blattamonas nauphoetae]
MPIECLDWLNRCDTLFDIEDGSTGIWEDDTISKIVGSSSKKEVFFTGTKECSLPAADARVVSLKTSERLDDGRGLTDTFDSVGLANDAYEMELTDTTAGSKSEPVAKVTLSVGVDGWEEWTCEQYFRQSRHSVALIRHSGSVALHYHIVGRVDC